MEENKSFLVGRITGKRKFRDEFQLIDKNQFDASMKTLLILPGNPTSDVHSAERYARCASLWLDGVKDVDGVQVCSMIYSNGRPLFEDGAYNFNYNYEEVVDTFFMPYFVKDGKRLPESKAIANIKNLVVFTHSAGAVVMNECMAMLENKLKDAGYSADEVSNIYSNIVMIAYSPYAVVYSPIKRVYISPVYDTMGGFIKTMQVFPKDGTTFSRIKFKVKRFNEVYDRSVEFAIKGLQDLVRKYGAICMTDSERNLNIMPDLLFDRGGNYPEDHGIAGVINYPLKSPEKTKVGEVTTTIMCDIVQKAFERQENNFDIGDLYNMCAKKYAKLARTIELSEGNAK